MFMNKVRIMKTEKSENPESGYVKRKKKNLTCNEGQEFWRLTYQKHISY